MLFRSPPLAARTSTAGLCPCPSPTPKRRKVASPRRSTSPRPPPVSDRRVGAETGAALRRAARGLSPCVQPGREPTPLHLEVTVSPGGEVLRVRTGNVARLPPPAAVRCVQDRLRQLRLPPFDDAEPLVFSLSLAL